MLRLFSRSVFALLCVLATADACCAQINVESADGDQVTIGPGGITVNKKGSRETVDINQNGIYVNGTGGRRAKVQVRQPSTVTRKVTTTSQKSGQVVAVRSIEDQVASMEVQVYGAKTQGKPLLVRIEKLEMDSIGKKGAGTLKERVTVLLSAVGGTQSSAVSHTSTVQVTEQSHPGSNSISVSSENGSVAVHGSTSDIVINDSNLERTIKSNHNNVVINASSCELKFQGVVNHLTVNGSGNRVYCESVAQISLNGADNDVSWKPTPHKPRIENVGADNVLRAR